MSLRQRIGPLEHRYAVATATKGPLAAKRQRLFVRTTKQSGLCLPGGYIQPPRPGILHRLQPQHRDALVLSTVSRTTSSLLTSKASLHNLLRDMTETWNPARPKRAQNIDSSKDSADRGALLWQFNRLIAFPMSATVYRENWTSCSAGSHHSSAARRACKIKVYRCVAATDAATQSLTGTRREASRMRSAPNATAADTQPTDQATNLELGLLPAAPKRQCTTTPSQDADEDPSREKARPTLSAGPSMDGPAGIVQLQQGGGTHHIRSHSWLTMAWMSCRAEAVAGQWADTTLHRHATGVDGGDQQMDHRFHRCHRPPAMQHAEVSMLLRLNSKHPACKMYVPVTALHYTEDAPTDAPSTGSTPQYGDSTPLPSHTTMGSSVSRPLSARKREAIKGIFHPQCSIGHPQQQKSEATRASYVHLDCTDLVHRASLRSGIACCKSMDEIPFAAKHASSFDVAAENCKGRATTSSRQCLPPNQTLLQARDDGRAHSGWTAVRTGNSGSRSLVCRGPAHRLPCLTQDAPENRGSPGCPAWASLQQTYVTEAAKEDQSADVQGNPGRTVPILVLAVSRTSGLAMRLVFGEEGGVGSWALRPVDFVPTATRNAEALQERGPELCLWTSPLADLDSRDRPYETTAMLRANALHLPLQLLRRLVRLLGAAEHSATITA